MELEVRLPQLDELRTVLNNVDTVGAGAASDIELLVKLVLALDKKIDALALATAAPGPVQQMDLPFTEKPKVDAPAPVRKGRRKAELISTTTVATGVAHAKSEVVEPVKANGEAATHQDDEGTDALRAQAQFEARRVQRTFGVGGMRAAIKKVAGAGVLQTDDVPDWQLLELLAELRAM